MCRRRRGLVKGYARVQRSCTKMHLSGTLPCSDMVHSYRQPLSFPVDLGSSRDAPPAWNCVHGDGLSSAFRRAWGLMDGPDSGLARGGAAADARTHGAAAERSKQEAGRAGSVVAVNRHSGGGRGRSGGGGGGGMSSWWWWRGREGPSAICRDMASPSVSSITGSAIIFTSRH